MAKIHRNTNSLNASINEFLEEAVIDEVREVSIEIFNQLVQRTPVDTGRLRANWQISTNEIPSAESTTNNISLNVKSIKDDVYIVNNSPYAVAIADGRSKQANAGWVEHSIAVVVEGRR